ncbi:glycoprotein 3-alpha-L-fucosyltransferase A-like [Apostichopus japonicus]|uniref:glycoprotein 3-alpha-L-fucosyltransferase A-like n=1 Tax=Stichopus japonicus TaxID=307972 RepID=UPI003AB213CE
MVPERYDCQNGIVNFQRADINSFKFRRSKVVIFAGGLKDKSLWKRLLAKRTPRQIWVFTTDESPLTTMDYIPPKQYNIGRNIFNVTYTYHSKSDISVPYGRYQPYATFNDDEIDVDYHTLHHKFAMWMSSHCDTISWDRTKFVKDLAEYMPIDRFGKCGNMTDKCKRGSSECGWLQRDYMFILAFENSCCEEYISEKFWKVLSTGVSIPVVIGAKKEDYKRLGPPNSFIHVDDFKSMQELASYLQKVANNSVLYNSFFKWKKFGTVSQTGFRDRRIVYNKSACLLMDFLKNGVLEKKETFDLYGSSWLGGCKGCSSKAWIAKYGYTPGEHFTAN